MQVLYTLYYVQLNNQIQGGLLRKNNFPFICDTSAILLPVQSNKNIYWGFRDINKMRTSMNSAVLLKYLEGSKRAIKLQRGIHETI